MKFSFFTFSDKGPRPENQDSFDLVNKNETIITCIADGVGGANCGKLASEESVKIFLSLINDHNDNLKEIVSLVNDKIKAMGEKNIECKGMATTLTASIVKDKKLLGVHVGDSRLHILRGNGIKQLTEDQTEVNYLFKAGRITEEERQNYPRKHVLKSAIGITGELTIQLFEFDIISKDRILLSTDGVHNFITKKDLRNLSVSSSDLESFGEKIKDNLSSKKLNDNYSFILIEVN